MDTGIVKWFNSEKGFGFLTQTDGTELFFHINNGNEPFMGRSASQGNITVLYDTPKRHNIRNPKVGDEVMYCVGSGYKGPIASIWMYKSDYVQVEEQIKTSPMYRIMCQYRTMATTEWDQPRESWRGILLTETAKYYDPKTDWASHEIGGDFEITKWWETKPQDAPEDQWKRCSCPVRT